MRKLRKMKKDSKIKISQTYARALFEAALAANNIERVQKEMVLLKDVEDLKKIASPFLDGAARGEIIELLKNKADLSDTTAHFLELLAEKKVLAYFADIAEAFEKEVLNHNDVAQILIETVQPLSKNQHEKLVSGLKKKLKKEVHLSYKLNENLLGGLILHYGSLQIDDSVLHKLTAIENTMKGLN